MNIQTETPRYSAQVINEQWIKKVEMDKTAAEGEGTAFTRMKLRQESFARQILPPIQIQPDELDRDVNDDQPRKVVEKEPNSIAVSLSLRGRAEMTYFKGERYPVYFFKLESKHFKKTKMELATYQNDIRKIISDNMVKDIADMEDKYFLSAIDAICAGNASEQVTSGQFGPATFAAAREKLSARRQPIGKLLITDAVYSKAINLPASQIGFEQAGRFFDKGVEASDRLYGIPLVITIKQDIFKEVDPDHTTAYLFSPENFIGKFFVFQDATLFIEERETMIEFWVYEIIGIGIGNTLSSQKIIFTS